MTTVKFAFFISTFFALPNSQVSNKMAKSCNIQAACKFEQKEERLPIGDTVTKDIPKNIQGLPRFYYTLIKDAEKKIGLSDIEKGTRPLEIRFWFNYSDTVLRQLVVVKKEKDSWSGNLYHVSSGYNTQNDKMEFWVQNKQTAAPISGWDCFMDNLYTFKVSTLPDWSKIDGYLDATHGNSITIEVATYKSYRIYNYVEPGINKQHIWQAASVENIMGLLEKEFGFKRFFEF
jgi:hypothetical protein